MVLASLYSSAGWLGVGVFVLLGCGSGLGDPTGSTCPADSSLSYETFGRQFMESHCLACHTSTQSPTLSTLGSIQSHRDEVDRAAAAGPASVNTYMPEEGSVTEAERRQLGEWLACGAP